MIVTRSVTQTDVHQNMPDYPSSQGITTSQLKTAFDAPATGLKDDINRLETELEAATASASLGADDLFVGDTSGATVQAKLEKLYTDIQSAILGVIPDDSITKAKLVSTFSSTIPVNTDMAVLYLASKYKTPSITAATPSNFTIPQMTNDSHAGYTASMVQGEGSTPGTATNPYQMFNRSGTESARANGYITIQIPDYMKITSVSFSGVRVKGSIYVSNDNSNYTEVATYSITSGDKTSTSPTVTCNGYYKYIKITFNRTSSSNWGAIYDNIVVSGKKITSLDTNSMTIAATETNELLSAYQTGQIVKITTPSNYLPGVTINSKLDIYSLGAKAVPNDLQPSIRYSLVYDGTKFVHE